MHMARWRAVVMPVQLPQHCCAFRKAISPKTNVTLIKQPDSAGFANGSPDLIIIKWHAEFNFMPSSKGGCDLETNRGVRYRDE